MTLPLLTFDGKVQGIHVDLDQLVVSRALVQANSGGGKSHALRYLLEQTYGRIQHIVIDREGEFSTLRAKYSYLLVGPEGEVAADTRSAKLLARKILELETSTIIDLSEMSLTQQREYVAEFVSGLNHLPRDLWKDCLVVIDEAHLFAPEKGKGESVAREAIAMLLSTGRKRGFCAVLATQRVSKIDKDVSSECLNRIIGRTSDDDIPRAGDLLGFDKARARTLRDLERGQFYCYGPAIGVNPVLCKTGSVKTSPPARGANRAPAPPTPEAIKSIAQALADLPKEAQDEKDAVAYLQRENTRLARELRQAKAGVPATPAQTIEKKVIDQDAIERAVRLALANAEKQQRVFLKNLRAEADKLQRQFAPIPTTIAALASAVSADFAYTTPPVASAAARHEDSERDTHTVASSRESATRQAAPAPPRSPSLNGAVDASEQKILNAIAFMESIGATPQKTTLAFFAGYTVAGRFNNLVGGLRTKGLLDYPSPGTVRLTEAGHVYADGAAHRIRTLDDLHDAWLTKLPASEAKVLRVVLDVWPGSIRKDELAAKTDYEIAGRFNNIVGGLRSLGAISYPKAGEVKATEALFPEGLA